MTRAHTFKTKLHNGCYNSLNPKKRDRPLTRWERFKAILAWIFER